jgi:cell division protein FtsI/penicillin-binding protein 2
MRRWLIGAGVTIVVAAIATPLAHRSGGKTARPEAAAIVQGASSGALAPTPPAALKGLDLARIQLDDAGASAPLPEKKTARLTLDPALQRFAAALLSVHKLPEAAVVVLETQTGRVLAYASRIDNGIPRDLNVEATAPAASVFKIVTGASLVENAQLGPDTKECYSGGEHSVEARDLEPDPRRDRWCTTLAGAMGRSVNTVFARLASQKLQPAQLEATAKGLGFGEAPAFDVAVQPSQLSIPADNLGYARMAAGFWNTTLSPVHAAMLSATMARGGEGIRPYIVGDVVDGAGNVTWTAPQAPTLKRAVQATTAQAVTTMMDRTVSDGTSYRAFHDASGGAFVPNVPVAGKTGTLTDSATGRFYTWFTGFAPSRTVPNAPAGKKQIAVAVLVVNQPTWHVKANVLARELLRAYFTDAKSPAPPPAPPANAKRQLTLTKGIAARPIPRPEARD